MRYVHQQLVLEEWGKRGVQVHFLERPVGQKPEDLLLVRMQGVIAEYERAKILERTRRGRPHKVRNGQMLPFYSYRGVRTPWLPQGMVVLDEVEAAQVRQMYHWVLEENLSARQVAKRLNAQVGGRGREFVLENVTLKCSGIVRGLGWGQETIHICSAVRRS